MIFMGTLNHPIFSYYLNDHFRWIPRLLPTPLYSSLILFLYYCISHFFSLYLEFFYVFKYITCLHHPFTYEPVFVPALALNQLQNTSVPLPDFAYQSLVGSCLSLTDSSERHAHSTLSSGACKAAFLLRHTWKTACLDKIHLVQLSFFKFLENLA